MNLYDEKLACLENIPPAGEVFLIDFGEDGLHRVVCNVSVIFKTYVQHTLFYHGNFIIPLLKTAHSSLFFIDSGEIIEMSSAPDLKMFSLSKRAQNMSARGIPCKIIEVFTRIHFRSINQLHFLNISLRFLTSLIIRSITSLTFYMNKSGSPFITSTSKFSLLTHNCTIK